jgi:hypothetical protein
LSRHYHDRDILTSFSCEREHLYRQHSQPKFRCRRCREAFEDDAGLELHSRALFSCQIQQVIAEDGFDADQEKQLRSRRRIKADVTEADKWKYMYRILFPQIKEEDIPSPCK